MRFIADLVYLLAGLLYLPIALYHALIAGKNRRGWGERFGFIPEFGRTKQRIWIHGVSLGEINATPKLAQELGERLADTEILFSTTTDTGYARAVHLYGKERVFRFPLDFSFVVARVLRKLRPSMIVLVELEAWYNLVNAASRRGIPVVVVNGRLTARSAQRFGWLGGIARSMFGKLTWVGAQDEAIAARFRELGVADDRIEITSSLKWDSAAVADSVEGAEALSRAMGMDLARPLWVCGSTGPGEEAMILSAFRRILGEWPAAAQTVREGSAVGGYAAEPILAIVPRKPERFDEVARSIERAGFECVRRSEHHDDAPIGSVPESAVFLGDTMGELRKFYSLARVVFVGRTLIPLGGSDPMEVAALGKAMVVGPHTDNFRMPLAAMQEADAVRMVDSAEALPSVVGALLQDEATAGAIGRRAREVVVGNQGATQRTAESIIRILQRRSA